VVEVALKCGTHSSVRWEVDFKCLTDRHVQDSLIVYVLRMYDPPPHSLELLFRKQYLLGMATLTYAMESG